MPRTGQPTIEAPWHYGQECAPWAGHHALQSSSSIRPRSFFEALTYPLAYFTVISARDGIDNPSSMPPTVPDYAGISYLRRGHRFAGSFRESAARLASTG